MSGVRVPLRPSQSEYRQANLQTQRGVPVFNVWEVTTVKSISRHAAIAAGLFALVSAGTPAVQPAQAQAQPQQRGGPRRADTPVLLVATFRSDDRKLAVDASDAVRRRIQDEYSLRDLEVLTKNAVNQTLEASGYRPDSALSLNDLMELSKTLRGDYVLDGLVMKVAEGVKIEPRVLIKRNQTILTQPLPAVTGKDAGAAAKDIEKNFTAVLKSMPLYKNCES